MSTEDTTKTKPIRRGPRIVGRIILTVVILVGVWFGATRGLDAIMYVTTEDASVDGNQVTLSARTLGRIATITTEEGARVAAGDVLVTLDDTDLRAQEAQAQAALTSARRNLELARVNLNSSRDDLTRIRNLYENDAATRERYDHAVSAEQAAQAQYAVAQAQIDTSTAQLGVVEAQLQNTEIRAPMDGTVDTIERSEGDVVQPSQAIMTINDLEDLWVVANVEETDIARVKSGAQVRITVDAFGRREFPGTVEMIYAGIVAPAFQIGEFTKTTQRIPVRIRFADGTDSLRLLPGMSVEVKIRTPTEVPGIVPRFLLP